MKQPYAIPAESQEFSEEIKKSRFITYVDYIGSVDEAKSYIQAVKERHPDARHHCWGFVAGAPDDTQVLGFSDDGEPSGTAGKPILAQLMGSGLGNVIAVVVRYYGGVLLGTGGLVKAYSHGVKLILAELKTELYTPKLRYAFTCDYAQWQSAELLFQRYNGDISELNYAQSITMIVALPYSVIDEVAQRLRDMSKGELELVPLDNNSN